MHGKHVCLSLFLTPVHFPWDRYLGLCLPQDLAQPDVAQHCIAHTAAIEFCFMLILFSLHIILCMVVCLANNKNFKMNFIFCVKCECEIQFWLLIHEHVGLFCSTCFR